MVPGCLDLPPLLSCVHPPVRFPSKVLYWNGKNVEVRPGKIDIERRFSHHVPGLSLPVGGAVGRERMRLDDASTLILGVAEIRNFHWSPIA